MNLPHFDAPANRLLSSIQQQRTRELVLMSLKCVGEKPAKTSDERPSRWPRA